MNKRCFVAITGGQGVGKSTFCRKLSSSLIAAGHKDVQLIEGLGERMAAMGIPLGSGATTQTIFAVWAAHLERQAEARNGLIILDRCAIDALAYTRALRLGTLIERQLFEQVAKLASERLNLVINLRLTEFFRGKGGSHESSELREEVVTEINALISHLGVNAIELDAAKESSVQTACRAIEGLMS